MAIMFLTIWVTCGFRAKNNVWHRSHLRLVEAIDMAVGQFFKRSHGWVAGQGWVATTVADGPRFFRRMAGRTRNQTQGQPGLKLRQRSTVGEGLEEFRFAV